MTDTSEQPSHDYVFDTLMEVPIQVAAPSVDAARAILNDAMNGMNLEVMLPRGVRVIEATPPVGHVPTLYAVDGEEVDGDPPRLPVASPHLHFAWLLTAAEALGMLDGAQELSARMGLTVEQVTYLVRHAQAVWSRTEFVVDRPRIGEGRVVPQCGVAECDNPASQVMTYQVESRPRPRSLDLLCDEHVAHYRVALPQTEPEFRPLSLDLAQTVPAHLITPWTRVWSVPDSPEWEATQAWRWVVQSVTHLRHRQTGELRVRWTYADNRVQSFGYHELVTGWFAPGDPI